MKRRIGVYVARDRIAAVRLDGEVVGARWEIRRDDPALLSAQLRACIAALAAGRWTRPHVTLALSPALAQTKRIAGLPALPDVRDIELLVRSGARRFFVGDPDRMLFAIARRGAEVLAERMDKPTVEAAAHAARDTSARLVVVSAVSAVGVAPDSVDAFEVASAAARLSMADVPSIVAHDARRADVPRWRARLAIGVAAAGLLVLLASPIAAARLSAARSSRALSALAAPYRNAAAVERELTRITQLIAAMDEPGTQRSTTMTLAAITRALPFEAALVALSTDSAGASLVVVADDIMPVVASLDSATAIGGARVLGPVTRERVAGQELERATIRVVWSKSVR